jgi:ferrous iron transport protein B
MELPPYHVPTLGGILHHTWHRLRGFIVRAGKIIVLFSAALSLLNGVALDGRVAPGLGGDSLLGGIGRGLAPVFRPMGIERDNWPAVVGLFSGVFAKEAVVGTLDALYTQTASPAQGSVSAASGGVPATASAAWAALRERLSAAAGAFVRGFAPRSAQAGSEETHVSVTTFAEMREHFRDRVSAFAYMLFVLIYVPCMATIAAIYREAGPRWTVFSVAYLTGLAWVVSTAFYQAATLARHPASSGAWVGACLGAVALFYLGLHAKARRTREAS